MSCILYYSNYCEPSKKLLQIIKKTQNTTKMHFICIDKRVKEFVVFLLK
jgi:phage-related protein